MRLAVLACLAVAGLALAEPGGWPAEAQGAAINVSGWQRSEAATGTIFYRCSVPGHCGLGSTVSYRRQADGPLPDLATFRAQNESADRALVERSDGRVARVDILETTEGRVAGASMQTAVKMIDYAGGQREYMVTQRVSDGTRSYSIVSTGGQEGATRANLQIFLPIVMLAGEIGGQLPRP